MFNHQSSLIENPVYCNVHYHTFVYSFGCTNNLENYGKYCPYELYFPYTFQLYISVLVPTHLHNINELSMIIDHEGTSSKYGHLCPLVDKCNVSLPQKALRVNQSSQICLHWLIIYSNFPFCTFVFIFCSFYMNCAGEGCTIFLPDVLQ